MSRRLVVMFSFRAPDRESNPYVHLLVQSLEKHVEIRYFSWKAALLGRYDVLHFHWPETLLRSRSRTREFASRILTTLLLARTRMKKIRVVRTLHNVTPHESGSDLESRLLRAIDSSTDGWIVMNVDRSVSELNLPEESVWHIPHGHFKDWYQVWSNAEIEVESGTILTFGRIRPYKGIEGLLVAFREASAHEDVQLRVAGAVDDAGMLESLRSAAAESRSVSLELGHVSDARLTQLIRSSQIVVLPYSRMLNSGAVLAALSLGRPVLVPRTPSNEALASEVGAHWVHMFEGPLKPADLLSALEAAQDDELNGSMPDLSLRDWERSAESHLAAYRGQSRR